MGTGVMIVGGARSDFKRNWGREGLTIGDLIGQTLEEAFADTGIDSDDVGVVHVGNFIGELLCHQGHLGGVVAEVCPGLRGVPAMRHEAACASGSMAVLAAMSDIMAGRYEVACVVGVEMMRQAGGDVASASLGCAAHHPEETSRARFVWPMIFDEMMGLYQRRYGLDYGHLMAIARQNFANARRNPQAQTRDWQFDDRAFSVNDEFNPVVHGALRRQDCAQITDGAAVLLLCSESFGRRLAGRAAAPARIRGWGHRTVRINWQARMQDDAGAGLVLPHVRTTIDDAFRRAGCILDDLDGIETHDCFSITQYMAIDHFGLTAPGESWKAVENGDTAPGGRLPFNAGGGLIGGGHPVGATGVRMMLECARQVGGQCDTYQIAGARNMAMLNIGGSATTVAVFVIGRDG